MDPDFTGGLTTGERMSEMRGEVALTPEKIAQATENGPPERPCKNHPDRPARIDSLGRSMGICDECLTARGRAAGISNQERGVSSPPVSIPLNHAKYAKIKEWLKAQAEENERSLQNEIMFLLKQAMRLDLLSG
jgi:hypothetical protein